MVLNFGKGARRSADQHGSINYYGFWGREDDIIKNLKNVHAL